MNILLDKLPKKINDIEINTDFRIMIMFELLMLDPNIPKKQKLIQSLKLFYKDVNEIDNIEEAIKDLLWFYRCGKEEKIGVGNSNNKKNQIYNFDFDNLDIYSAFMQQYNIDLNDANLHWWKFKSLFNNLSEDTKMVKIMGYRSVNLSEFNKDKKKKDFYMKMKKQYELPDMRSEEEKEADMEASFW